MSKVKVLALVIVSIMFCSVLAFAQGPDEKNQPAVEEKMQAKQMDKGQMGGMIMQMMGSMQKQMVATNDGGVIVLAGSKLLKYDKDLNLVKEAELKTGVELKMDVGSMQDIMKNMQGKYGKKNKITQGDIQEIENK
ncbi:MAG: hypothetical protein NTY47_05160 [Candidatus Omnitrophica bacterium]|nr:hypothetical protein [Candidatus Omnitrophota bacterium]